MPHLPGIIMKKVPVLSLNVCGWWRDLWFGHRWEEDHKPDRRNKQMKEAWVLHFAWYASYKHETFLWLRLQLQHASLFTPGGKYVSLPLFSCNAWKIAAPLSTYLRSFASMQRWMDASREHTEEGITQLLRVLQHAHALLWQTQWNWQELFAHVLVCLSYWYLQ